LINKIENFSSKFLVDSSYSLWLVDLGHFARGFDWLSLPKDSL